ncbi:MAG: hypothetical protein ACO3JL_02750 [Myxococcota bacterium]
MTDGYGLAAEEGSQAEVAARHQLQLQGSYIRIDPPGKTEAGRMFSTA